MKEWKLDQHYIICGGGANEEFLQQAAREVVEGGWTCV